MMRHVWLEGVLFALVVSMGAAISGIGSRSNDPSSELVRSEYFEGFDDDHLSSEDWLIAKKQWGGSGVNGGVVPRNVALAGGNLILEAHGDEYDGPVTGGNRHGVPRAHGKRVGAAVATKVYYGSGRYEVRAKIAPNTGVCSAFFSLHYQEGVAGQEDGEDGSASTVSNHEINIELPGRPSREAIDRISFEHGLFNTWRGVNADEYTDSFVPLDKRLDDGKYHVFRYDWHTGGSEEAGPARVEFYIDGKLTHTSYENIPTHAGRFWVGLWFPDKWAGQPRFDTSRMYIDWVRITPFNEPNDRFVPESYPDDGWAGPSEYPNSPVAHHDEQYDEGQGGALAIADFEGQPLSTLLGGNYYSFNRTPSVASVTQTDQRHTGETGQALQLDYEWQGEGWCGFWMRFVPEKKTLDAQAYRYLTFYVKGEKGGEVFDIGLSWDRGWTGEQDPNPAGRIHDFLRDGVTTNWQKVVIPIKPVLGLDQDVMSGFALTCRDAKGRIYIDDVRLEK